MPNNLDMSDLNSAANTGGAGVTNLTFIGFGEAGNAIAKGLKGEDLAIEVAAFDIKLDDKTTRSAMQASMRDAGVAACDNREQAIGNADIIISVVTADAAAKVAQKAAKFLKDGALYLDMNSCAPATKAEAAIPVTAAGGIYVDVAVMAPIIPRGHKTPMLAAAGDPDNVNARLTAFGLIAAGLAPRFVGTEIGRASTIKMLRSVIVKGMEALTTECFRAAVKAGVASEVAASLDASSRGRGWAEQASYNMERMTAHGTRRAAEMREAAKTLLALEVPPTMTNGTIIWEDAMGALDLTLDPAAPLDEQMKRIEPQMKKNPHRFRNPSPI